MLDAGYFKKSTRTADGLAIRCIDCAEAHAAHGRNRYNDDPEIRKVKAEYEKANRERRTEYARNRYNDDPEIRKAKTEYKMELYRTNPKHRADHNFSSQIRQSLRNGKNGQSWEALVGYTLNDLVLHLEAQFGEGMTWENYGEWHIDHRTPRTWFDYESVEETAFKECWALSNLQPKWGKENIRKGNRYED
jgi:phage protein D